ncbi:MAG: metal-dependent transcriptional regulator [Eubacterium sp.]
MHLQESGEMYLETLLILSEKSTSVRSLDISEYMGFSKPSVSRAIHLLKDADYVKSATNGSLFLTDEGRRIAEKIYERHRLLTKFLIFLGVDAKTAEHDACKMEHGISDQSFEAIKQHVNQYTKSL